MVAVVSLGSIALLSVGVLLPTLRDAESRVYGSKIGYPALQRRRQQPIQVKTFVVGADRLNQAIGAPGQSVAAKEVNVRPEINSTVSEVLVKEGDWVHQGQLLLRLESSTLAAQVKAAEAEWVRSQTQLKQLTLTTQGQQKLLESERITAQARLDSAQQRVQQSGNYIDQQIDHHVSAAQIQLDNARQRLIRTQNLYEQGAVSEFQLLDAKDQYAERQRDFDDAKQGVFPNNNDHAINRDVYLAQTQALTTVEQQLNNLKQLQSIELKTAQLQVTQAQLALEKAQKALDRTSLYAATDGLVSKVAIDAGDFYEIGEPGLITISQEIMFQAYVDQTRLNDIHPGDAATVHLVAYPGQAFDGKVVRINPAVETEGFRAGDASISNQYTYSVWVKVNKLAMPPGLQGFVQFHQDAKATVIPESAVTHLSAGEGLVMVVEKDHARVRQVKLGKRFDNLRAVVDGLKLGEQVILNPRALNPGDRVVVQDGK